MPILKYDGTPAGVTASPIKEFTGGDAALKDRAVEVLKSHGGQEVVYWGEWTIHRL